MDAETGSPPPLEPVAPAPPPLPFPGPDLQRALEVEPPPRPLGRAEGTLYLIALPVLYLFGSVLSFLPSLGTPIGYVVLVDQAFNMAGIALLALLAFGLPPRREMGLARPPARRVLLVAGFAAANFLVISGLSSWINSLLFSAETVRDQSRGIAELLLAVDTPMEKVLLFLALVVGAPLAEETLFRGLLQNLLVRWWRPWVGIFVTALVFTAFHFVPLRFPLVFEIAVILGLIYHLSGSLWLCITCHAVTNALSQGIFYGPQHASEALSRPAALIPAALAWLMLGALLLNDLRRGPAPPRTALPMQMRGGWFLLRLAGFWAVALVLGFLAIPLAGTGAVALQRKGLLELQPVRHDIDESLQTDAAWERFFDLDSAVRAQVKTGKVPVDVYVTWLQSARDDFRRSLSLGPRLDAKTAVETEQPLPVERAALDRILAGAVKRFGIAPPSQRTLL